MITMDMHLHSSFSGGKNTPEEIVREATRIGYKEIAIIEHVRRTTDWLDDFCNQITILRQSYSSRIKLHSGIEAKVINLQGAIDARAEFYGKVDLVFAAFHQIPVGEEKYLSKEDILRDKKKALEYWFDAMMKVLENDNVTVIGHPTAILKRNNITVPFDLKKDIARKAAEHNRIFEVNIKYRVPDEEFIALLNLHGVKLIPGSDSHSVEEMRAIVYRNEEGTIEHVNTPS